MKNKMFSIGILIAIILGGCSNTNEQKGYYAKNGSFISTEIPKIASKTILKTDFIKTKYLNISYQNIKDSKKLDIYLPNKGKGPFPVIIGVHGGGFKFGSKDDGMNAALIESVKHGYALVLINYSLSGEKKFPGAIEDVKSAIRFVKNNADNYNINPKKVALWGASSGGNLVSLAGTTNGSDIFNNPALGNPNVSTEVKAVVDWFGPINFLTMDEQFKNEGIKGQVHSSLHSFESQYLGADIRTIPEIVKMTNPETYISKSNPPFLIQHGTSDIFVPNTQSIEFAQNLEKAIGKENVELHLLKNAGHGSPEAFDSPENLEIVFKFLDKHLK
ncbi:alpha/beta hydrolase fold domain-containing protein [Cetobacterium sp.]|uniref:alpha/beta hydrolase fold domain-containing protein n=1 Tax=Cetobacterium sp. TaxID=2071632 RepID=UPI003F3C271F